MIKPNKLNKGDYIGVVAPSSPIIGERKDDIDKAKEFIEKQGFKVKYSKNLFFNTNDYSATAKEKAEDINNMFKDKKVKMIWCASGGANSNSTFEYLDYEAIKQNPKIICGYSDITSLINIIHEKTELVTFSGMNFRTIVRDEDKFSFNEVINRFVNGSLGIGSPNEENEYKTIREGTTEGELVGGNLFLTKGLVSGKYNINFENKILFMEELGLESDPATVSSSLYFMKQNGIFNKIRGIWLGNYNHESGIPLEKIVEDVLENEYSFPIIKSNNFGHVYKQTVIPIGVKAKIDTTKQIKIELLETCINM